MRKMPIIEISEQVRGGDEAALFAEVLYKMYIRYAETSKRWKLLVMPLGSNTNARL